MEYAKDFWINNRYCPIGKNVCADCFNSPCIKQFINDEADEKECDYCDKSSNRPIATSVDSVFEFILEGINTEWGDPDNEGVGYESREGGYTSAEVINTFDLLWNIELDLENGEIESDFFEAFDDRNWCQRNPHSLREQEEWYFDWEKFSEQVKYETRFVFYKVSKINRDFEPYANEPYEVLEQIAESIVELDLIKNIQIGTGFFRGRKHDSQEGFNNVSELGPPTSENAIFSNRMSPAGIPLFYGSNEKRTVLAEIEDEKPFVTIAEFKTLKDFNVLDLTQIPKLPEIFCRDRRHLRKHILFLKAYLSDFIDPIEKDGREHTEYVPTQIVTEYLKNCYQDDTGEPIRGIIYPSSRIESGVSCVLFFNSEHCCQDTDSEPDIENKWLDMDINSIRTFIA